MLHPTMNRNEDPYNPLQNEELRIADLQRQQFRYPGRQQYRLFNYLSFTNHFSA